MFRKMFLVLFCIPMVVCAGVNVSGTIKEIKIEGLNFSEVPVEKVNVKFFGTSLTAETNANGQFTLENVPACSLAGIKMTKAGYKTTYTPILGVGENDVSDVTCFIFTTEMYSTRIQGGSAPGHTPGKGDIVGVVTDTKGGCLAGAAVQAAYLDTEESAGTIKYFTVTFSPGSSDNTSVNGFFAIYNVEPGRPVVIKGIKSGTFFSSCIAEVYPDCLTLTQVMEVSKTIDVSGVVFTEADDEEDPLQGVDITLPGLSISAVSNQDGAFLLRGLPIKSLAVLKVVKTGYMDIYLYGYIDDSQDDEEDEEADIEVFMVSNEMVEGLENEVGEAQQADKGAILIDSEIKGVEIRLYNDEGVRISPISAYYDEEDGSFNPALTATVPDGSCLIMNIDSGYYYLTGYKQGFEFPVLWIPVFAGGLTVNELETNTPVGRLYKMNYHEGQLPSVEISNDAQDVPMFRFNFGLDPNEENIILNSITFTLKGTGNPGTALVNTKLYYDSDHNGIFETEAGTGFFSDGKLIFSGLDTPIGFGFNQNWLVVYNFNGTAISEETFGVDLLRNTDVVATGAESGLDITCNGDEIVGNLMTILPSPAKPYNISPANGAIDVPIKCFLQASDFSGAGGDFHISTHWQVREYSERYDNAVVDIQTEPLTSFTLSNYLINGKTYYWRVRYQNNKGVWSQWSDETWFTIITTASSPEQPVNRSPANGAIDVSLCPLLQASDFINSGQDSQGYSAAHWQITLIPGDFTAPVFDSGRREYPVCAIEIPAGVLVRDTTYWWHVRYQDGNGAWSPWSEPTCFTTEAVEVGDINGSGVVDISDVILCLRMAVGLPVTINTVVYEPEYPEWVIHRANINSEAGIDISDVILILRKSIGL